MTLSTKEITENLAGDVKLLDLFESAEIVNGFFDVKNYNFLCIKAKNLHIIFLSGGRYARHRNC